MSTGREKDQKDFDLEQMVKIIDTALESNDQRIKDALRALLTITVLCTAERPQEAVMGPFERMLDDMRNLNRRLSNMEDELNRIKWDSQRKQIDPFVPPTPYGPTTGTNPNGPKPMWGPSWSSSSDWGSLPDVKKWTASDDPNYKGSSASTMLAEDFLRKLQENK